MFLLATSAAVRGAAPPAGAAATTEPDRAAIQTTGKRTLQRFTTDAASWDARLIVKSTAAIHVSVVQAPGLRRTIFYGALVGGDRPEEEIARIVERDGAWYFTEGQRRGKYRPYEIPPTCRR